MDRCSCHCIGGRDQGHPPKRKAKRLHGCLRRPYKQLRKEEKRKAKEKRKDIPLWIQTSNKNLNTENMFILHSLPCISGCNLIQHEVALSLIWETGHILCSQHLPVCLPCTTEMLRGFHNGSAGKEPTCTAGDAGSIPESGRSPGGGSGKPLLYSCLQNPMDRGAWRATVHRVIKSQTRLKQLSM